MEMKYKVGQKVKVSGVIVEDTTADFETFLVRLPDNNKINLEPKDLELVEEEPKEDSEESGDIESGWYRTTRGTRITALEYLEVVKDWESNRDKDKPKLPEKIDIIKESIVRETKVQESLPKGWGVMSQSFNVVEDKINEILDYLKERDNG